MKLKTILWAVTFISMAILTTLSFAEAHTGWRILAASVMIVSLNLAKD